VDGFSTDKTKLALRLAKESGSQMAASLNG